MKKFTAALITLLAFAAGSASAIDVTNTTAFNCVGPFKSDDTRLQNYLSYCGTNITSATSAATLGTVLTNPAKQIGISTKASIISSLTVLMTDAAGNTLNSTSIAVGPTPAITYLPSPTLFTGIKVSVTTILSTTNALSATIIEGR